MAAANIATVQSVETSARRGVPAGAVTLRVWHPYAKLPGGELVRAVQLPAAGGRQEIVLDLRTPVSNNHAY